MESATENSKSILKSGSSSEEISMLLDDPESKINWEGGEPIIYYDAWSIYEPELTQEDKFTASPLDKCNSSELKHQTATTPLEAKRVKVEDPKGKANDGGGNVRRIRLSRRLQAQVIEDHEVFIVKEINGISDVRIRKQDAVCRHCFKLMSEDSHVLKVECECTKFSLVLQECPKQNKCCNCDQQIKYTSVSLSTVPPKEENPKIRKRLGCFGK